MFHFGSILERNLNNFISTPNLFIITGTTEFCYRNYICYVLFIDHFMCLSNYARIILKKIHYSWITYAMHTWFHATHKLPDEISQNRYEVCTMKGDVSQRTKRETNKSGLWWVNSLLYSYFYSDHKLFLDKVYLVPCVHMVLSTVLSLNQIAGCYWNTNKKDDETPHITVYHHFLFLHGWKMSYIKNWP